MAGEAGATSGFPWAAFGQVATTVVGGHYSRQLSRTNYQMQLSDHRLAQAQFGYQQRIGAAQHGVAVAQAQAQNQITNAQNQMARVEAGMQNFMTAENNRRRMEGIGAAVEAATVNLARNRDSSVAESFEARISSAEQMGAYAANAALAGVGGASVDAIESSMRLKDARATEYHTRNAGYADYDALSEIVGLKASMYTSLDRTVSLPGMNFSHASAGVYVPGVFTQRAPRDRTSGSLGMDLLGFALGNRTGAGQIADYAGSFFKTQSRPALPFSDTGDY